MAEVSAPSESRPADTSAGIAQPSVVGQPSRGVLRIAMGALRRPALVALSLAAGIGVWWGIAVLVDKPVFLPSPGEVWRGAVELIDNGLLLTSIRVSFARILVGWAIGSAAGIPIGLLLGRVTYVRQVLEPYVDFFRFIPPIAFLTLAVTWFGLGETSKVILIVYTAVFIVATGTMLGVLRTGEEKSEAARSLGASELQVFRTITVPASIPHIITAMKLAMGTSFMTVISAEMIAADTGIGYLIFNSRVFLRTDWIFVGIITLGLMGLVTDMCFRVLTRLCLHRYDVRA